MALLFFVNGRPHSTPLRFAHLPLLCRVRGALTAAAGRVPKDFRREHCEIGAHYGGGLALPLASRLRIRAHHRDATQVGASAGGGSIIGETVTRSISVTEAMVF
ncbi:MAG: hypothetical protein C7B45_08795 [Sulfobacillus acidophilus]|uniref:Uncharacterized protein n=1 Tax=Sulfobacillus acidophilus TaxID=53633 RepID=A0A2T2WIA7_9FIRM|nr:MAG: hypothetical protein C7B45_08795 [Sulfobacillus acidophilus]